MSRAFSLFMAISSLFLAAQVCADSAQFLKGKLTKDAELTAQWSYEQKGKRGETTNEKAKRLDRPTQLASMGRYKARAQDLSAAAWAEKVELRYNQRRRLREGGVDKATSLDGGKVQVALRAGSLVSSLGEDPRAELTKLDAAPLMGPEHSAFGKLLYEKSLDGGIDVDASVLSRLSHGEIDVSACSGMLRLDFEKIVPSKGGQLAQCRLSGTLSQSGEQSRTIKIKGQVRLSLIGALVVDADLEIEEEGRREGSLTTEEGRKIRNWYDHQLSGRFRYAASTKGLVAFDAP